MRIRHRYKVSDPDSVGVRVEQPASGLLRQPRLARTAHPGERDQPASLQQAMDVGDLPLAPDEARQRRGEVVPGCGRGLLDAAGQKVAVHPLRLRVRIGAVRRTQLTAQAFVLRQCLRRSAHRRMPPHHAPDGPLVERVDGERALQRIERLDLVPRLGGRIREVDEELAEAHPEFLPRPDGPVLEPILGQQISGVRSDCGAQIGKVTAGPADGGQPFEGPYVDLDKAVREQHHEVVPQLEQPVAGLIPCQHPPRNVQRLMQIVHRRHRGPVRPQRLEQHIPMQPLLGRQRQQLHHRPRLPQTPHPRIDGQAPTIDPKPPEHPNPHDRPPPMSVNTSLPTATQLASAVRQPERRSRASAPSRSRGGVSVAAFQSCDDKLSDQQGVRVSHRSGAGLTGETRVGGIGCVAARDFSGAVSIRGPLVRRGGARAERRPRRMRRTRCRSTC